MVTFMSRPNRRQAVGAVTPLPRRKRAKPAIKRAREWKIAALAQLVEFALGTGGETLELITAARNLIGIAVRGHRLTTPRDQLLDRQLALQWREQVLWCRERAKAAITLAA